MKRRKMLIGLGSLAAGGAAVTGSGAFSKVRADRTVNVDVEPDENSFLHLSANHSSLENGAYAQGTDDGALELVFDEEASVTGGGVNSDATNFFDNVFQVLNHGTQQSQISIDKSGLDNPDQFGFYWLYSNGTNGGGAAGSASDTDGNGVIEYRETRLGEGDNVSITTGFGVNIGVFIDTRGLSRTENWETGSIVVEATEQDNSGGA